MFSPKADGPLTVQVPGPAEDRPSWTKVGVIAAIGFVVGIAWPKIAGVRLGPSVPESGSATAAASAPPGEASGAPSSVPPSFPALATSPAAAPAPATAGAAVPGGEPASRAGTGGTAGTPPGVAVAHGFVFGCKTSDGDALKGSECGTLPGLDGAVMPRLRRLADCPDAAGASGKLHLVVHVDFPRSGVTVDLGRNQSVSSPEALLACAKTSLAGAGSGLGGVQHENPRYSVAYVVTFGGGSGNGSAGGETAVAASIPAPMHASGETADSSAQVVWDVAIIRDAPKSGKVVARLQRGTTIHLGPVKDGWYPVRYGDAFSSEGWVYRGAIGR